MSTAIEKAETAITPMSVLQSAVAQGADIDKLTKLMELQERWEANEARKAFNAAMSKFKENPPLITKNKHVKAGAMEYDHATLDHVSATVTKALSAVGISHKWTVEQAGPEISVSCVLTHEMGHSERTTLRANPDTSGSKNSIQAIGSAVTYLQRYTLLAATGIAAGMDDDTQSGSRLPDEVIAERIDWIRNANNSTELQKVFAAAYKDAAAAGDTKTMAAYIKARDERREALRANS